LSAFLETAQSAIGEKEDEGRKLSMTPSATAKEVSDLLLDMFQQDLPVLYKGQNFRSFLIEFQDIIKTVMVENDIEKIGELRKKFEKLAKKTSSRMRRLKRKLRTREHKAAFEELSRGFEVLHSTTLADGGIFSVQKEYLEAILNIRQMKIQVSAATDRHKRCEYCHESGFQRRFFTSFDQ
jgi:hypothetical protein